MKEEMLQSIGMELMQRKDYLDGESVKTIYFGGGTPSMLSKKEIALLLEGIYNNYNIQHEPEVTIEANPDDLTKEYLKLIKELEVNRLNIGVQSFHDDELKVLNRRHTSVQAIKSIENAKKAGFKNISIDLIYAIPNSNAEKWQRTLDQSFVLGIQHISAYLLTIEVKSLLAQLIRADKLIEIEEDECLRQFQLLVDKTIENGFIQYEISNFGKKGYFSIHNSNYWKDVKYIGIGPSAHSYDQNSRQWNVSNNKEYIEKIKKGNQHYHSETLDEQDKYNDYILTGLRTMWGVNLGTIEQRFGEAYKNKFLKEAEREIENRVLEVENSTYRISYKAKFITDAIIEGFISVEDD